MNAVDLLPLLESVRESGAGWSARCPAHDDRHNSLSVGAGDDGRVLLKCHAGCPWQKILAALNLTPEDLFEPASKQEKGEGANPAGMDATAQPGLTLERYADAKKLSPEFLKSQGLSDCKYKKLPAVRIPYLDLEGEEKAVRYRLSAGGEFRWKGKSETLLYGLWRLKDAEDAGYVVIVEGESDCHTLWSQGIPAIGLPGATNWKEARDADLFDSIPTVFVVIEPDKGGEAVSDWVGKSRIRDKVKLVRLEGAKDPSALYLDDPERFRSRFNDALEHAREWVDLERERSSAEAQEALEACRPIAEAPAILQLLDDVLEQIGLTGDKRCAKLLYLAVTEPLPRQARVSRDQGPLQHRKILPGRVRAEALPALSLLLADGDV